MRCFMVRDNAGWAAMVRRFRTGLLGMLGDAFHRSNASSGDPAAARPVRVARESLASGMTLLRLTGRLEWHTVPAFRRTLQAEAQRATHGLILSLTQVPCIDSSGSAVLVEGLRWCRKRAIRYILADLTPEVQRVIELTRLQHVLTIQSSDRRMRLGREWQLYDHPADGRIFSIDFPPTDTAAAFSRSTERNGARTS